MAQGRTDSECGVRRPGPTPVDTDVVIVITRFGVRTFYGLIVTWIDGQRLQRHIGKIPGLLKSIFVFETPHSALSVSIWESERFISQFGAEQPFHVSVANAVFPRVRHTRDGKPEIWSIRAKPVSLSNNLVWKDLDLRSFCMPRND